MSCLRHLVLAAANAVPLMLAYGTAAQASISTTGID
jgi:hypothetical protein